MELDEVYAAEPDPLWGIRRALRRLEEQLTLAAIDDTGELAETARMLALKRGCRRR